MALLPASKRARASRNPGDSLGNDVGIKGNINDELNFKGLNDIISKEGVESKYNNMIPVALHLEPLLEEHARTLLSWRYPPPYDFYNPRAHADAEDYVQAFLAPEFAFHAVLDDQGQLVGFCSFGKDGQVPGGQYTQEALDIGLGMRPDLTGRGFGLAFVQAILDFARKRMQPDSFRLTVANFNQRALALYHKMGFCEVDSFCDTESGVGYTIMVRPAQVRPAEVRPGQV